jgi:UDP-glucose 4-epimerase
LESIFSQKKKESYPITTVIHFAALKSVPESIAMPFEYYENNVGGTLNLLKVMQKFDCFNFVFSSSATVYG